MMEARNTCPNRIQIKMKVVAFVPIRLNSKRVAGKNLKMLGGKPLLWYVLDTLTKVRRIDEIYVYCSSDEVVKHMPPGVKFLRRPTSLDRDETLGQDIYEAFTTTVNADVYILAHTTSPFIKAETVSEALDKVMDEGYDSAFSAEKIQTFTWFKGTPLNYDLKAIPRTQDIEPVYVETSAFFMFRREVWAQHHQRIGFHPYMAVIDKVEGVDIDWPDDFDFAEKLLEALEHHG